MRTVTNILAVAFLAVMVGCATFQSNAGKLLASSALTVDAGMKSWAVWVAKGQATPAQEAQVKAAYQKYQVAIAIANDAYAKLAANNDQAAWTQAANILTANQAGLLQLITQFTTQ